MKGKGERERGRREKAFLRLLFVLLSFSLLPFASGHPANVPSSRIKVAPDGTFTARIRFDVIAFATGATPRDADDRAMNALLDGPSDALAASLADAAGRFRQGFITVPGGTLDRLEFPNVETVRRFLAGNPSPRLPAMLTVLAWGHLPKGTHTVAFRYPDLFDTVIQTVEFPYEEPVSEPVDPDHVSTTLTIPTPEQIKKIAASFTKPREEALVTKGAEDRDRTGIAPPASQASVKNKAEEASPNADRGSSPLDGGRAGVLPKAPDVSGVSSKIAGKPALRAETALLKPRAKVASSPTVPSPPPKMEAAPPSVPSPQVNPLGAKVAIYLRMGFTHIVPQGLDHILFVLGLFLLGSNTKALIKQITAITLALTALGIIRLPGRIIEPVIAISIAFVAIENLFTREVRPWRTAVVFAFGLVHGMGFAEVFADAGLRGAGLLTALLSFNVGVELGQLSVVAMAFGVVGWFRKDPRYRSAVVVPASLVIATVALFWSVQRIAG